MSFFYDAFNDFYIKNRSVISDGEGGTVTVWQNGAVVKMALDLGNAEERRIADASKLQTVFTATFPINTPVKYDDYLESVDTGVIYRITSDPKDNKTPPEASHQCCYANAIRTELPK